MPSCRLRVPDYSWTRDFVTKCSDCGDHIALSVPYTPGGSGYMRCRCGHYHVLRRSRTEPQQLVYGTEEKVEWLS